MQYILIAILSVLFVFHVHETQAEVQTEDYIVVSCEQVYHAAQLVETLQGSGLSYAEYNNMLYGMGLYPSDTALLSDMANWIYLGGYSSKDLLLMCEGSTTRGM
jgi:hypothetical protein